MASNYGLAFGFRRSDETLAIREGRQKVPATGAFLQGQAVTFDSAAPGYLKLCGADPGFSSGFTGILVQEESHIFSTYGNQYLDIHDLSTVLNNRLAIIWTGNGGKVWFKNIASGTRADGRAFPAITMVAGAGATWPVIGDPVGWNGTAWYKSTLANAIGKCTLSNQSAGYIEAVLSV